MIVACSYCASVFDAKQSDLARGRKYCSVACYRAAQIADRAKLPNDKKCGRCLHVKPLDQFSPHGKNRKGLDNVAGWCKSCRCEDERKRRSNPRLIAQFKKKYENDMEFRAMERLRAIGKRCRRKNIEFDLDHAWLTSKLRNGRCELTGLSFDMAIVNRRPTALTPSVDRIVTTGGYTKANCRLVVHAVNIAMNAWGLNVFLPIAEALLDAHRKRAVA